jgi:ferredoxin-type protein NapH
MAKKKSGTVASRLAGWRWWIQAGFLFAWLDPFMIRMHTVCSPVFHCYSCPLATFACPIGVIANFSAVHLIPFAALGTLIFLAAAFGSFVCGWACPFGFLQDLAARVPTPKFTLPPWMGYFRYVSLIGLVLLVPYFWGEGHPLFFCRVCPAGALEGALPSMAQAAIAGKAIVWPTTAKTIILALFLLAMFFTWRPWCTLFCPLGAIYSFFDSVSLFFLSFHKDRCRDCENCRSLCRDCVRPEWRVNGLRCVRCLECANCNAVTVGTVFAHFDKEIDNSNDQNTA